MTDENMVEAELHDEIDNEIVEETLEEAQAPTGKGGAEPAQQVSEPESVASVDKAAKTGTSKVAPPKTKAGMISAMVGHMQKMNKTEMSKLMASYMEDVEFEGEVVAEQDTSAELDALVESEATLSDEFKEKTSVIFEAAVKSKLSEEVSRLEEQYKEELAEEVSSMRSELVEKIDSYLNYVVESWMEENRVAIQNGLRTEIAENFMDKMKGLFVESYIDVPESKVDLVDELASQVDELEESLNTQTGKTIELSEELEQYKRDSIIAEAARGLADTQKEKLAELVEGVDFDENFASKVATIKESYFTKEISETVEVIDEEPEAVVETSSIMDQYLSTMRKLDKN